MALGNQNKQNFSDLIFLRNVGAKKAVDFPTKGKNGVPYFLVSQKVDGKYAQTLKTDEFSGELKKIVVEDKYDPIRNSDLIEKYGQSKVVKFELFDAVNNQTYIWRASFGMSTRSLFNRVLNLQGRENIRITLWANEKGFDNFCLYQNGQLVKPKYLKDDPAVPAVEKIMFKGKEQPDDTKVNLFFEQAMENIRLDIRQEVVPALVPAGETDNKDEEDETPF